MIKQLYYHFVFLLLAQKTSILDYILTFFIRLAYYYYRFTIKSFPTMIPQLSFYGLSHMVFCHSQHPCESFLDSYSAFFTGSVSSSNTKRSNVQCIYFIILLQYLYLFYNIRHIQYIRIDSMLFYNTIQIIWGLVQN